MNTKIKYAIAIVSIMIIQSANAQIDNKVFSKLVGAEPTVEINLGPMMLNLLSSATEDESDIANILSSLKGINVTVFEISKNSNMNDIRSEIGLLSNQRTNSGYEKLAMVKEEDSLVYIFAKVGEEKLTSLNIFALDDDNELVLIDIKGNILMSQIGALMSHFDVDLEINGLELKKQTNN
ncbi:MAG: DUF4252 domain-containing protein [Marinicellaceae bacterium]